MAGNDMRLDAQRRIVDMVEPEIRKLFEYPMNEYQDPSWVQAAELFVNIVIPWESVYISNDGLYTLAQEIVQEAKEHNCQVTYYYRRGYNAIANTPPKDGFTRKEEIDYRKTIHELEQWLIKNYLD